MQDQPTPPTTTSLDAPNLTTRSGGPPAPPLVPTPGYVFKAAEEFAWAAAVGAGVYAIQVLVTFDPAKIADPHAWIVALGAGCIRAGAGAVVAWLTAPHAGPQAGQ